MHAVLAGAAPDGDPTTLAGIITPGCLLIAVDGGAGLCLAAGLTPDLVVGDMDSVDPRTLDVLERRDVELVKVAAEKDFNDLQLGVDEAAARGATSLTATGVVGGRVDHLLCNLGTLQTDLPVRVVERDMAIDFLSASRRECVVSGNGATFSVIALSGDCPVSVTGARWPLDEAVLEPLSSLGLSNRVTGGDARVTAHRGRCVVVTVLA